LAVREAHRAQGSPVGLRIGVARDPSVAVGFATTAVMTM